MPIGLLGGAALSRKICPIWWNNRTVEFRRYSDESRAECEVSDEVFSLTSVGFVEVSDEVSPQTVPHLAKISVQPLSASAPSVPSNAPLLE